MRAYFYKKAKKLGVVTTESGKRWPWGSVTEWQTAWKNEQSIVEEPLAQVLEGAFEDNIARRMYNYDIQKGRRVSTHINPDDVEIEFRGDEMGDSFTGNIVVKMTMFVAPDRDIRTKTWNSVPVVNLTRENIIDLSFALIEEYKKTWGSSWDGYVKVHRITIILTKPRRVVGSIREMKVKKIKFNKLNLNIKSNNDDIDENCVDFYLIPRYGKTKGLIKKIRKLAEVNDWSVKSLINFLKNSGIPFYCFRADLTCIEYYKNRKTRLKTFYFIVSNEHIYPITRAELKALKKMKYDKLKIKNIEYKEDLHDFVQKTFDDGDVIKRYKMKYRENKFVFTRALIGDILYVDDKKLAESYKMFSKIMGFFPISFNYKTYSPLIYLAEKNGLESSFNFKDEVMDAPYYYHPYYNKKKNIISIDKNKCYSDMLRKLKYIPVFNSQVFNKEMENDHVINDYYYYHVKKITKGTKCFLSAGWCFGFRIKHFSDAVEIDYYKIPKLVKNPYSQIINQMYKYDDTLAKYIINIFNGICRIMKYYNYDLFTRLVNNEKEAQDHGMYYTINSNLYALYEQKQSRRKYKFNLLPIAGIIVDMSVNSVVEKLAEFIKIDKNLKVVKIKTDSLAVTTDKIKYEHLGLDKNDINGWKKEEFVDGEYYICTAVTRQHQIESESNNEIKKIDTSDVYDLLENGGCSILYDCLAGSGKTYECINHIIPLLKDKKIIIISPQHSGLEEYYLEKLNAKVIQYFTFNKIKEIEFMEYDYIIVDECGKLEPSHIEYAFKNCGKNTNFIFLGDKHQLLPYGYDNKNTAPLTNPNIRNLFDFYVELDTNYRNMYTKEEYENMWKLKYFISDYEKNLIGKIGKINITVTRKKMDRVNWKIVKTWEDEIQCIKIKKGGMFISEFNKYSKKRRIYDKLQKIGIHNCIFYEVIDYDNEKIILKDKKENKYTIPMKLFIGNFNYGYAITSFRAQGMSIDYDDLGIWDWPLIKRNGRQLYTILSRIRDITEEVVDERLVVKFD